MRQILISLLVPVFSLGCNLFAQSNNPDGLTYKSGWSAMMKLGTDLHKGLDKKYRDQVSPQPISMETDMTPFLRPSEELYAGDEKPLRAVWISAGFVDLVNRVAHAKA